MVSSSRLESLAQRFAPYIDELQDFFRARKVPFGSPDDLIAFPTALADPAFADEMVSMVRSIIYRENEALPVSQLTEIVALAVGGAHLSEISAELQAPVEEVRDFVTSVARPARSVFPSDVPASSPASSQAAPVELPDPAAVTPAPNVGETAELLHLVSPDVSSSQTPSLAHLKLSSPPASDSPRPAPMAAAPTSEAASAEAPEFHTNDRLSRALAHTEEPAAAEVPSFKPEAAHTERAPFTPTRPRPQPQRQTVGAFMRNAYWIPGVCVLLLTLGTIFFMRGRPAPPSSEHPVQAAALPTPALPKPSAYGPSLHRAAPARLHDVPETAQPSADLPEPAVVGSATAPASTVVPARSPASRHSTLHSVPSAKGPTVLIPGMREGVFLASSGMMAAHLLSAPAPSYPKLASFARVEGEVIVQVVVSRDGRVEATRVLQGPHLLRSAAEHAIRRWRYRPYVVDGKPTDVATIVTVNFQLRH